MKPSERKRPVARDEIAAIERNIESGVKKQQAVAEALDSSLTVKAGDATKVKRK